MMKKLLLLVALLVAALPAMATAVDLTQAQSTAQRFFQRANASQRLSGSPVSDFKLLHAEANSTRAGQAVYYIFNSNKGFVIISGDDCAPEVLAYGDQPLPAIDKLPANMMCWLGYYKSQMEVLQARPGMRVKSPALRSGQSVEPMIEAMWDQGDPYYGQCPMAGDRRAQTGCAATSLAQVFYKWKFPTTPTPVIPGYTTVAWNIELPALPSIRFDWDNMLPTYTIFSPDENKQAVAQLMRYIGQAEHMDYTAEYGEAYEDDIVAACHTFGYMGAYVAYKSILYANGVDSIYIDDDTWNEMLQGELVAGRPVVYCAISPNPGYDNYVGHAFDVDGYNAEDGKYHVNWGWSGRGNGYFALNAFIDGNYSYNLGQLMVMGIEPPAPIESYTPVMLPADSAYINLTQFRADWTDETSAENVTSYTLEVTTEDGSEPGVYERVLLENFSGATDNGTRPLTKFDSYCDNKGWTGSNVYEARGNALRLGGGGSPGILTSPAVDMTQSGGKMTVVVTMKPYQSADNNVPVTISCGDNMESFVVTEEVTQTVVLRCGADTDQKVTITATDGSNTKRLLVSCVEIWSSTASAAKMRLTVPAEEGDSTYRLITGLTDRFYTVKDLTAGGTFNYRVKANYVNLTESEWSNIEQVTLFENGHPYELGDMNHDHQVEIDDVAILINMVLGKASDGCAICGDMNNDGKIEVDDVALVIRKVLGQH